MKALEEIKARADELGRFRTRDLASNLIECGREYTLLARVEADHHRVIAALEALEAVIAEHEARTPFPDADEISKAYSLGKHHGYDRVRHEIAEALA